MEHVVFFPAHDGSPAFRRVATLEDAVRLVEHLRNVENVSEVSVHALAEVPLAFKAWYRVEVPGASEAPVAEQVVEAQIFVEPVPTLEGDDQPVAAVASANDGQGRNSLGFFSR
jgi:hypothetical protein